MVQERIIMVQIRTEGPCLMRLLVLGKSRISQISHYRACVRNLDLRVQSVL